MEICGICGQTKEWHDKHNPRHKFSGDPGMLNGKPPETKAPPGLPGDPALRVALVEAGLIKYEDIVRAEERLREGKPIIVGEASTSHTEGSNGSGTITRH